MFGQELVASVRIAVKRLASPRVVLAGVPERDEGVPAGPTRVVSWDVKAIEPAHEHATVGLEPGDEVHVRPVVGVGTGTPPFDPTVPWTHVLADVAAVRLGPEFGTVVVGNR